MPYPPTVEWPVLAGAYITAVESGQAPGAYCRARFGLSVKQWEKRRSWMTHLGWLPPTTPPQRGPHHQADCAVWAAGARAAYEAKLARITVAAAERDEREAAETEARQTRGRRRAFDAQRRAEVAGAKRATRPSSSSPGPVLEAFL